MIRYYSTFRNDKFVLKAISKQQAEKISDKISQKHGKITEFMDTKIAYIFVEKELSYSDLVQLIDKNIVTGYRDYQIELITFTNSLLDMEAVIKAFYSRVFLYEAVLFNKKKEAPERRQFTFLFPDASYVDIAHKCATIALNKNSARNLQIMPENFCNSEKLADFIADEFSQNKDLEITVLNKKQISDLNMGLLLSVNKGSTFAPRVVVIEYNGNPNSDEKVVFVGKGITFDTGGMNTKGYHMEGMKFDMSGSVIAAYAVKAAAELKIKKNVSAVMCITDNRQDGDASLPENVYESMAGISVEVTDTDAEGRLVLADGLYYAATKLNATTLVDVATLTGACVSALGHEYSAIYSTDEENWYIFNSAAANAKEKVWRMPMHDDFHEPNTASLVADLNNYNNDETSDHNTAAMFLKQFTNNVPYIHCDIAGTADLKGKPLGALLDTLVEFAILK
ncbi:M17 family metallopeptidase [Mycoplasma zalophidermidis]|uniref:Probable cytosol aminopeptidase n=1 Tax=Mycoplasma zalophidermidis TaxID=398174 RepID=A0ABS6DTJ7_9MOLU|nr:M17 family metallopeptidase [Mycoplasma zalophidermidis]MBU4689896.1 leucyl aminopeptidase family protein [Mycoplasma zalophidermidis]MBU4693813.1 leucyl aminopeptidase family protein [Mycoplasma zalophidermidis]MCR8966819.1 M17 family metallopeptidase [Mycoplasma zalophidermidis]